MCDNQAEQTQPNKGSDREWAREQETMRRGAYGAGIVGGANTAGPLQTGPLQTSFDSYHRRVTALAQHNVEAAQYQLEAAKEVQELLSLLDRVPQHMKGLVGDILQRSSSARHFKL